jgi:UDP-2,4-diacetamido-2,4,6-trideoxy-beta-L-altropyranose hydrolase
MKKRLFKDKKIAILTEGGKTIGIGHIIRCLALYQAFEANGARPELIVNGDKSVDRFLKDKNYQTSDWIKKPGRLFQAINGVGCVVIDSYLAPASLYRKIARQAPGKLVVIDDLNRLAYPRGIVVSPSIYGDSLNYPRNKAINYLLGKDYVLLRKPFWFVPAKKLKKKVKNVIITLGGSDQRSFINQLLDFLSVNFPSFNYHLVASNFQVKAGRDLKLTVHRELSALEMRRLMQKCDLAISAGGQTLYELARVGTPVIAICLADNQALGMEFFSRLGMIENAGMIGSKSLWVRLAGSFNKILRYETRVKMRTNGANVIDGKGPQRIIEEVAK